MQNVLSWRIIKILPIYQISPQKVTFEQYGRNTIRANNEEICFRIAAKFIPYLNFGMEYLNIWRDWGIMAVTNCYEKFSVIYKKLKDHHGLLKMRSTSTIGSVHMEWPVSLKISYSNDAGHCLIPVLLCQKHPHGMFFQIIYYHPLFNVAGW